MSNLEIENELKFGVWCINLKMRYLKLRLASDSAWPDRTILYNGHMMVIEWKRKGEKPTPLQIFTLQSIRNSGFFAMWTDNIEVAKARVTEWRNYVNSCPRLPMAQICALDGTDG